MSGQRVTNEQARRLSESLFAACVQIGVGEAIDTSDVAADLLDARAEIERLRGEIVKERLNTEVAAEMVRELKARPQPGEVDRAVDIIRRIIYASDGCVGHQDCNHSIKPWKDARAFLSAFDAALAAAREGK